MTLDVYADLFEDDLDDVAIRLDNRVRAMSEDTDFSRRVSKTCPNPEDDPLWRDVA